jgi:hypothetical protein
MFIVHESHIDIETSIENNLSCAVVDQASMKAAEIKQTDVFEGCPIPPEYAVSLQPTEDQVIPVFMCRLHFNSFRQGLKEGVAVSEDMLK